MNKGGKRKYFPRKWTCHAPPWIWWAGSSFTLGRTLIFVRGILSLNFTLICAAISNRPMFFFVPDNNTTGRNFQIPSNWVASIHWLRNVFERAHCRLICILIDSVRGWSCWKIKQFQWQIFSAKIFALEAQTCSKRIHFTFFDICAQGQSCNERLCFNQNSTDGPRSITLESNGDESIALWTLYNFAFKCVVIGWNARPQIREKWRGSQRHLPPSSWFIGSLRPNASSNRLALKRLSIENLKSYRMI